MAYVDATMAADQLDVLMAYAASSLPRAVGPQ